VCVCAVCACVRCVKRERHTGVSGKFRLHSRHTSRGQTTPNSQRTNLARGVDVTRHDTDLALAGLNDTGAVGADEAGLAARLHETLLHAHHVLVVCTRYNVRDYCEITCASSYQHKQSDSDCGGGYSHLLGDTLSDTDGKRNLGVNRLDDGRGSEGRGHVNHSRIGSGVFLGLGGRRNQEMDGGGQISRNWYLLDRVEDRQVEVLAATLARGHAANHLGAIFDGLLAVEGTLQSGNSQHALDENCTASRAHRGATLKCTCLPVKPWQMTLVSLLIRTRGLEAAAYRRLVAKEGAEVVAQVRRREARLLLILSI